MHLFGREGSLQLRKVVSMQCLALLKKRLGTVLLCPRLAGLGQSAITLGGHQRKLYAQLVALYAQLVGRSAEFVGNTRTGVLLSIELELQPPLAVLRVRLHAHQLQTVFRW
jgi:hypothetical protein